MKKIATVISAVSIAVASASVSAWGWGDNGWGNNGWGNNGWGDGFGDGAFDGDFGFNMGFSGRGHGRGYGNGNNGYNGYNGYAPYGYAPYAAPVAPAVLTEEQQKAIADQQAAIADQHARYVEQMQAAQKQAAEFYANQPAPVYSAQPAMQGGDYMHKMDEVHAARIKEMEARMEESRKAAEQRHAEFFANRTAPAFGTQPAMHGEDFRRKMDEERAARMKEMDARMEEFRKASELRRKEARERFEARWNDRAVKVDVKVEDQAGA